MAVLRLFWMTTKMIERRLRQSFLSMIWIDVLNLMMKKSFSQSCEKKKRVRLFFS